MAKSKKQKKDSEKPQSEEVAEQQAVEAEVLPDEGEVAKEIDALKDENADLNSRILRLRADFDNFRKRTVKERQDVARRSNENLIMEIIPVLDHFEMGLDTAREHDTDESVYDGFKLVYEQLVRALEKVGVSRIDAVGEEFNPHVHECISHLPSEDVDEGMVSAQTRCGYKLGNYILRAAQVVVSSGPSIEEKTEETEEE